MRNYVRAAARSLTLSLFALCLAQSACAAESPFAAARPDSPASLYKTVSPRVLNAVQYMADEKAAGREGFARLAGAAGFALYAYPKASAGERRGISRAAGKILETAAAALREAEVRQDGATAELMGLYMEARRVLGGDSYQKAGEDMAGELIRGDGPKKPSADDAARVAAGFLKAYRYTGRQEYLGHALSLLDEVMKEQGTASGGIYPPYASELAYQATGDEKYIKFAEQSAAKCKEAGAPLWVVLLADLGHITGNKRYAQVAEKALDARKGLFDTDPVAAAPLAVGLGRLAGPCCEFVVVGHASEAGTKELIGEAFTFEEPDRVVVPLDPERDRARLERLGYKYEGRPVLYICSGTTCLPPAYPGDGMKKTRRSIERLREK